MAPFLFVLVAMAAPAPAVAWSESPAVASMALVALVLAGLSIVAERLHRTGSGRDGRHAGRDAPRSGATRARS